MHGVYWKTYSLSVEDAEHEAVHGTKKKETRWNGPFCPLCKDADKKGVRLKDTGRRHNNGYVVWRCGIHQLDYRAPTVSLRQACVTPGSLPC